MMYLCSVISDVILIGDITDMIQANECLVLAEVKGCQLEIGLWENEVFKYFENFMQHM